AADTASPAVVWYLTDRQGSVRTLVNTYGQAVMRYFYDGFGRPENRLSLLNALSTLPSFFLFGQSVYNRYLYTGREYDAVLQLQYSRRRTYDPAMGRWLQEDPNGMLAGDANLYRYVGNSPTNATAPDGTEASGLVALGTTLVGWAVSAW